MSEDFKINMKRADIGNCKRCGLDPADTEFKGRANECVTHMESTSGWWLRLSHHFDYTLEGRTRLPDTVGQLLCPKCNAAHTSLLNTFLEELDGPDGDST